jgi:hypothetical protein
MRMDRTGCRRSPAVLGMLLGLASGLLVGACAGRKSALVAAAPPADMAAEHAAGTDTAGSLRREADGLWARRGHPDTARLALEAYGRIAGLESADAALLARWSRACYLVANYVESDPARKDSLFLRGVEIAERAMALHPGFRKAYQETRDEKKAVRELGLESIESVYWYTVNLGKWASNKSLMVRLGNKSKLEAYNQRILDLDERYFHGAPHRFFGALPTKVPGGDLKLAKRHFEKALAIEPNYFGTRTLYAEFYATKAREKAVFLEQLEYVLNHPADALPDVEPENRYEQEYARRLKERTDEWFD